MSRQAKQMWMSVPEFARMIGVGTDKAHGIIEAGEIPHTHIGRWKRVRRSDAKAYLAKHSFGGQAVLHDAGPEAEALLR